MWPTVEVRWFYSGVVPPGVLEWFQRGAGKPQAQPRRVDHYLRLTDRDSLGIKLRAGRIEIKQRHHEYGVVRWHERVTGLLEHWRKWSFELVEAHSDPVSLIGPTSSWIGVTKERRLRQYRLTGHRIAAVSAPEYLERGCNLELTSIGVGGKEWWSLSFEAFGDESTLQESLSRVAQHVLAAQEPPAFDAQDSYSYPRWVAGLKLPMGQRASWPPTTR